MIDSIILHRDQKRPFVIIINDVNSNNCGRDFFLDLTDKLAKADLHVTYNQYYFPYNITNVNQQYGNKYESTSILYDKIPERYKKYEPWEKCSSAQLLIEVEGGEQIDN